MLDHTPADQIDPPTLRAFVTGLATIDETVRFVVTHLIRQGQPAIGANGCAYRGRGHTSCAIGCLIPDAHYTDHIEQLPATNVIGELYPDLRGVALEPQRITILQLLQSVHDSAEGTDNFREFSLALIRDEVLGRISRELTRAAAYSASHVVSETTLSYIEAGVAVLRVISKMFADEARS